MKSKIPIIDSIYGAFVCSVSTRTVSSFVWCAVGLHLSVKHNISAGSLQTQIVSNNRESAIESRIVFARTRLYSRGSPIGSTEASDDRDDSLPSVLPSVVPSFGFIFAILFDNRLALKAMRFIQYEF